jgi:myo-inositol-1(or 4)-monophosphatase
MTRSSDGQSPEPAELRALCERLAGEAGDIGLAGRAEIDDGGSFTGDTKSSSTDVVTEYDRAAEEHIVAELRRLRPDDAIVGEEGTDDDGTSGLAWYVDPIDGTTNFVYGVPSWSCSVAVARGDEMLAGAVCIPPLGELFSAAAGAGATRDGRPIRCSAETDLGLALVGTGFNYRRERRRQQAEIVARLIDQVRDIRRLGSAAADLCMVACGRLDVYYERHLNRWDTAAGELIAREAGAVASNFTGGPARPDELVVAAPALLEPFLTLLRDAGGRGPSPSRATPDRP